MGKVWLFCFPWLVLRGGERGRRRSLKENTLPFLSSFFLGVGASFPTKLPRSLRCQEE